MRQGAVRKATPKAVTLGRAPKQLRSRESFERVIQAATAILSFKSIRALISQIIARSPLAASCSRTSLGRWLRSWWRGGLLGRRDLRLAAVSVGYAGAHVA